MSFTNQSLLMVIVAVAASAVPDVRHVQAQPGAVARPVDGRDVLRIRRQHDPESATGEDGLRFFPFVFTLFIFVLCSNFFGMIPGTFTVTSQIAVTFALASLVILTVIVVGFCQARHRFSEAVRAARALLLLILLVPIEVISFLTRPISLSVRLFANMLAGHTMLAVFAGFVVLLGRAGGVLSVALHRADGC